MAAYRRVLQRTFIDGFETVHVPGEDYGEIHPKFAEENNDLSDIWNLIDADGNSHFVTFNKDYSHPLMTEGWNKLREFYHFEGKKQIFLNYLGQNRFLLTLGKPIEDNSNLPSFHSLSTKAGKTVFFDITLQRYDMALTSELVIPTTFQNFLWDADFHYLILCGKNAQKVITEINYSNNVTFYTKLGNGWEEFCLGNGFQAGDTIRFKFFEGKLSNYVHVYKLSN